MRVGTKGLFARSSMRPTVSRMDSLISLFSLMLAASALTFVWLSYVEGRGKVASRTPSAAAMVLEDLVGGSNPLIPHTIVQTPLD
jgi:hypothetical protein